MDIAKSIELIITSADYYGCFINNTEGEYDQIIWNDSREKPTWDQIVLTYNNYIFSFLKEQKQMEIRDKADSFLDNYAKEYGVYEKITWEQQSAEAKLFLLNNNIDEVPLLATMSSVRQMDITEFANRIVNNEKNWKIISGYIIGKRLFYQDQLDVATTVEEIQNINVVYEYTG